MIKEEQIKESTAPGYDIMHLEVPKAIFLTSTTNPEM